MTDEQFSDDAFDGDNDLRNEIERVINRASAENPSGTPDFVLAEFLVDCLTAYDKAVVRRAEWRGETAAFHPGGDRSA